jgi:peptide/nickel transport system ATP-binding protein
VSEPLLEVEGLRKYYYEQDALVDRLLGRDPVSIKAVDGVDFHVDEGETLGLVGESGCGKSTTGETVLRLREATDGTISFDGDDLLAMDDDELTAFRRRAQVVFQDPFSSLDPRMTAGEIIVEPLKIHGLPASDPAVEIEVDLRDRTGRVTETRADDDLDRVVDAEGGVAQVPVTVTDVDGDVAVETPAGVEATVEETDDGLAVSLSVGWSRREQRRERAIELLERVGLSADQIDRYPHEFSGGQRQRIGIARALALEPEFVVLDEPVSALDVSVQAQVLNLLEDLQEEYGLTYLFIAHDLSVVRHISDRVAVMYLGEIVETGSVEDIFEDPSHPYTEALLESVPRASTDEQDREVDALIGDVPSPRSPPSGCRFHTRCPEAREACTEEPPDMQAVGDGQRAACFRATDDHPYWDSDPLADARGSDD